MVLLYIFFFFSFLSSISFAPLGSHHHTDPYDPLTTGQSDPIVCQALENVPPSSHHLTRAIVWRGPNYEVGIEGILWNSWTKFSIVQQAQSFPQMSTVTRCFVRPMLGANINNNKK